MRCAAEYEPQDTPVERYMKMRLEVAGVAVEIEFEGPVKVTIGDEPPMLVVPATDEEVAELEKEPVTAVLEPEAVVEEPEAGAEAAEAVVEEPEAGAEAAEAVVEEPEPEEAPETEDKGDGDEDVEMTGTVSDDAPLEPELEPHPDDCDCGHCAPVE